jgi:hypothetical protein
MTTETLGLLETRMPLPNGGYLHHDGTPLAFYEQD